MARTSKKRKLRERPVYRVVAAYDTETCNIGVGSETRAYPILYILNDFADVPLAEYVPDDPRETVYFDRTVEEFMCRVEGIIARGRAEQYTPIICAYNLMFDLVSVLPLLADSYQLMVAAQSSTNVYYLDVYAPGADPKSDAPILRFWDTFFLEQNGLKAMGETAGVAKATGDWDYSLIRTPETPLTDLELFYAKRDVQVIPAYLRYLLQANADWISADMLGVRVLTKTGLVRQMAANTFGVVPLRKRRGNKGVVTMLDDFIGLCTDELPPDYDVYALRKACFRGGFTFTAANYACRDVTDVVSTDVTSMHHTFINGRFVPVQFKVTTPKILRVYAESVLDTSRESVLARYWQPFGCAFHAKFRFTNLRLRKGSCFEEWGVALIPKGKFDDRVVGVDYWADDPSSVAAEQGVRDMGYKDKAENPVFAFGKLYSADHAELHLNELELWAISRVYEWDALDPIYGEATVKFRRPPDYVTLQSNLLYKRKQDCKRMVKEYKGECFTGDIPASIPQGLADEMRKGTLDPVFLNNYYNGTVKGMFNGVYGTMAQDVFKPEYEVDDDGDIEVDRSTVVTPENFSRRNPKRCKVLYTYGMRIVGGSRVHLVLAMELLYEAFGGRVYATGGDTDSIKCHVPADITDEQVERALDPLLHAATEAISTACLHIRVDYPQWASGLEHVGGFEVENAGARYEHHMEYWNKARVSYREGEYHVTMAGLSRPLGAYHIEHVMRDLERGGYTPEQVMTETLGYNVNVSASVSFALQTVRPRMGERYTGAVTDYLGKTSQVDTYAAVALYPTDRMLGDTGKRSNRENVEYLRKMGRVVEHRNREVNVTAEQVPSVTAGILMEDTILQGVMHER